MVLIQRLKLLKQPKIKNIINFDSYLVKILSFYII